MKLNVLKKLTILENEIDLIREASKLMHQFNRLKVGTSAIVDLDEEDETRIRISGKFHTIDEVKLMINKVASRGKL